MARGGASVDRVTVPAGGGAVTIRFDGRTVALWWGEGASTDLLATRGDRVMSWPDVEACERYAREHGWPHASDDTDDGAGEPDDRTPGTDGDDSDGTDDDWTLDLEPAQAWLRGSRHTLDPVSALNLWNLQWDIVASRTGAYPFLGGLQGRCHDKLTFANVPYLVGADEYRPRWTPAELRVLRRTLAAAVHDLRTAIHPA